MINSLKKSLLLVSGLSILCLAGFTKFERTQNFDFADPKGVSGISFSIDSVLEPIVGQTSAISGNVVVDRENPSKSVGKIVVQTKDIQTASGPMTASMQGAWCLDPAKYPTIEFDVKKISNVKQKGKGIYSAVVNGDFTFHGVTKSIVATSTVTYLPNMIAKRGGMPGKSGDLLVLRAQFSFNRLDFNVAKGLSTDSIGNKVDVKVACVGVSPK